MAVKRWSKVFSSAVFRLIVIVLAVVIPMNLLTLILGNRVITEVERQVSLETQNALNLYMNQVDDALQRMNTTLYLLAREDVDFARLNVKEVTDQDEYYRQMQAVVNLSNTLENVLEDNSLIDGAFAYFPEKDYFIQKASQYAVTMKAQILEEASTESGVSLGTWQLVQVGETPFLLLCSYYRSAYYGAWIDLSKLARTFGFFEEGGSELQAFTDENGKIYFASASAGESLDINATSQRYLGTGYTLVKAFSERSDLCYVQVLSKSEMTESMPTAIRVLQLLSVMALLIVPVIMFAVRRWIVRPIGKLTEAMEEIEQGNMDFRIEQGKVGTEFEQINRNFNHMMDEVSELKINVYEEKLKSQHIKMAFLSQQIQPHFILNTLNILYSYEKEEYELSQKMILCLSKYFRYVVNANTDLVELEKELEHIQNYFEIQQARFLKTFRATVVYDKEVADCLVPPLLIQNFTENAIKHSLIPGQVVSIVVEAQKTEDDKLHICVYDTGSGIPKEVLERIKEYQETQEFNADLGVGIQNSIDRLDIVFGDSADLQISRIDPQGTRIDIKLPIKRKELGADERGFD